MGTFYDKVLKMRKNGRSLKNDTITVPVVAKIEKLELKNEKIEATVSVELENSAPESTDKKPAEKGVKKNDKRTGGKS